MYAKDVVIRNRTGLHARPASLFVACAGRFRSRITVKNTATGEEANAKSIIMLLALGLGQGAAARISAAGEDETDAVEELVRLIESEFGE